MMNHRLPQAVEGGSQTGITPNVSLRVGTVHQNYSLARENIQLRLTYGVLGEYVWISLFLGLIAYLFFSYSFRCVFAEMYKGKPILPGQSDLDQAHRIFKLCGSPHERNMPGWGSLPGCDGVRNFGPYQRSMEHQFSELVSCDLQSCVWFETNTFKAWGVLEFLCLQSYSRWIHGNVLTQLMR